MDNIADLDPIVQKARRLALGSRLTEMRHRFACRAVGVADKDYVRCNSPGAVARRIGKCWLVMKSRVVLCCVVLCCVVLCCVDTEGAMRRMKGTCCCSRLKKTVGQSSANMIALTKTKLLRLCDHGDN
jgi:hypothetical protein